MGVVIRSLIIPTPNCAKLSRFSQPFQPNILNFLVHRDTHRRRNKLKTRGLPLVWCVPTHFESARKWRIHHSSTNSVLFEYKKIEELVDIFGTPGRSYLTTGLARRLTRCKIFSLKWSRAWRNYLRHGDGGNYYYAAYAVAGGWSHYCEPLCIW